MVTIENWFESLPWIDRPELETGAIYDYVNTLASAPSFDLAAALLDWRRDGVVLFENAVDLDLIDALLSDVSYLHRHYRDFSLSVEVLGQLREIHSLDDSELLSPGFKLNSIHAISMAAAKLSLTQRISEFLGHVFRSPPCVLQSLTFYRGSQQPIHVDYPYVRCQSQIAMLAASWVPLEDISADSGPLAYYPGSHLPEVSGFFDWGSGSIVLEPDSEREPIELSRYLEQRVRDAGISSRVYCPKKGDVLVWHANLSHEGTPIRNNLLTRKSYVTHYTSIEAYPIAHMKPGAPQSGVIAADNGGYAFEYPWIQNARMLPSNEAIK